ncbi:Holliday junction resolvase RecU [Oceanobacillus sp. CF4.6]|uniref:Holliday junction resolvase RecU n=1 Tax=Oceanobacillus sp. CF4.6 TaxID=3373080 RepID=UPI003EE66B7E
MNYPNGQRKTLPVRKRSSGKESKTFSNRGMTLEEDINITNQFYLDTNKAVIHKKPTPVQIVNVNYPKRSAAVITEAYFKQASTTDYNGLYRGKYIDFEAKETKNKTLFPLANIHDHQISHMESIIGHGGVSFMIIRFAAYDETYFMETEKLFSFWNDKLNGGKKSISYEQVKQNSFLIPFQYQTRVDYLSIIDKLYF